MELVNAISSGRPFCLPERRGRWAFTLIELLLVIAVVALFLGFILPGILGSMDAMRLTEAGNRVAALFEKARMHATTTRKVAVLRFFPDPESDSDEIRYIQLFEISDSSTDTVSEARAIHRAYRLEEYLLVSMAYSDVFENAQIRRGRGQFMQHEEVAYTEFYIFPNGTTSLVATSPNPHLTLISKRDTEAIPKNPVVISFDSITAKATQFRR